MINKIINYFYKVRVEPLVNIAESKPTILSRISNIYENIKLFFLSPFKVESPELLSSPLSPCLSFTIPENPINSTKVKKFNGDQISAQQSEAFIKELEKYTLNEMPKSNIIEEIFLKNEMIKARLTKFDTNPTPLTPLTPLTPQENSLKELNESLLDWKNARGPLSMEEVKIKVNRELEEKEIKWKRKVQEVQINGRREVEELREKKIKKEREAKEEEIKEKRNQVDTF